MKMKYDTTVVHEDGGKGADVQYSEMVYIPGTAIGCGLTFFLYGGWCWNYLNKPTSAEIRSFKNRALKRIDQRFSSEYIEEDEGNTTGYFSFQSDDPKLTVDEWSESVDESTSLPSPNQMRIKKLNKKLKQCQEASGESQDLLWEIESELKSCEKRRAKLKIQNRKLRDRKCIGWKCKKKNSFIGTLGGPVFLGDYFGYAGGLRYIKKMTHHIGAEFVLLNGELGDRSFGKLTNFAEGSRFNSIDLGLTFIGHKSIFMGAGLSYRIADRDISRDFQTEDELGYSFQVYRRIYGRFDTQTLGWYVNLGVRTQYQTPIFEFSGFAIDAWSFEIKKFEAIRHVELHYQSIDPADRDRAADVAHQISEMPHTYVSLGIGGKI